MGLLGDLYEPIHEKYTEQRPVHCKHHQALATVAITQAPCRVLSDQQASLQASQQFLVKEPISSENQHVIPLKISTLQMYRVCVRGR